MNPGETMQPSKHVVLYSGGLASWGVAAALVDAGTDGEIVLLFADTLIEDADLYRFLGETVADFGEAVELVTLTDGRTPWEVFRDVRFIGNTRVDPCSRVLKREPTRKWLNENCDPATTVIHIGFMWDEQHRLDRARPHWEPWTIEALLCSETYHPMKEELIEDLDRRGIATPRLYGRGYPHNNCGGFCVKAGQGHFAHLLEDNPTLYEHHQNEEEALRKHLGADVSILRDRRGGTLRPLTMRELRLRIETTPEQVDMFDIGGCSCFMPAGP